MLGIAKVRGWISCPYECKTIMQGVEIHQREYAEYSKSAAKSNNSSIGNIR